MVRGAKTSSPVKKGEKAQMKDLTKEEKGWIRVVEEYVDRNTRVCLEEPSTAIVSLSFVGISGRVLDYARQLVRLRSKGEEENESIGISAPS